MKDKLNIGIIPDGNRKYAKEKDISLAESYILGAQIACDIVQVSIARKNIDRIVFYAFSSDNFKRPKNEIEAIIVGIKKFLSLVQDYPVNINTFGDDNSVELKDLFAHRVAENSSLTIDLLINYSPDWDFQVRPIHTASIPDLDVILRSNSSDRVYLSGFLPKQSSYATLKMLNMHWAQFSADQFNTIVNGTKDSLLDYESGI